MAGQWGTFCILSNCVAHALHCCYVVKRLLLPQTHGQEHARERASRGSPTLLPPQSRAQAWLRERAPAPLLNRMVNPQHGCCPRCKSPHGSSSITPFPTLPHWVIWSPLLFSIAIVSPGKRGPWCRSFPQAALAGSPTGYITSRVRVPPIFLAASRHSFEHY